MVFIAVYMLLASWVEDHTDGYMWYILAYILASLIDVVLAYLFLRYVLGVQL